MHDEIKRMKAEIADYEEKHGKIERKPNTVSTKEARKATACIRPLLSYIVKYAGMCDRADSILAISPEHITFINGFDEDLQAMQGNEDYRVAGRMLSAAVNLINTRDKYEVAEFVTKLSIATRIGKMDAIQHAFNAEVLGDEQ